MPDPLASPDLTPEQERQLGRLVARYPLADDLGRRFGDAGHELYLVGGIVRDTLIGRESPDLDFATSAPPEISERVLRGWADDLWLTGARYGTVSARKQTWNVEITTFRSDVYSAGSRHPQVTYGTSIESDLARRDFTINAMAVRVPNHRFVDPFGGLRDLKAGVLRTPAAPDDSFADDPLRMVRLARFASVLGAAASDEARKAATTMAAQIDSVSRERIRDELNRLLCGANPAAGLDLLCDTGLAARFLPEVPALRMETDPLHHHKDVYRHTLAVVENCPAEDLTLRLAALLHDIGKPATREFHGNGKVSFHGHDHVGARMARTRLEELRYPKALVSDVCDLVYLHLRFHGYGEAAWTDHAVRRYVRDAGTDLQLRRLNRLTRADVTTRNKVKARRLAQAMDELEERIALLQQQEEIGKIRPALDGRQIMEHLGLEPGPLVGRARQALLDARLERGPMAAEEAYAFLDAWAIEQGLA